MDFFKSFFSPSCTKVPPWSVNELHVAYYGSKSELLYQDQDSEVPPIAGDACYRVTINTPGRSVVLPEPHESKNQCIVGLRVKSNGVLRHAHLMVGSSIVDTVYENDAIFSPTILPIPSLHNIEVVADEDTDSLEISYVVRKLQNPSDHYRFWYDREIRKFVDGRLFLNGPISKILFVGRNKQTLGINGRPVPFEGETVSFEPLTVDFDEIEIAAITGPPVEIRATQLNLIEIKDGMLNLPFKR